MNMHKRVLHDIANEITDHLSEKNILNCSLIGGDFGGVIYLYYYSKIDKEYEIIADALLDKIFASLKNPPIIGSYCNGIAGLGIGLHYLNENNYMSGVDEALDELDIFVDYFLNNDLKSSNCDFLHGFIGIGFYYLMRYNKRPEFSRLRLKKIIDYLDATAIKDCDTSKWVYNFSEINKKYNISLSHGISSIIIFLSKIIKSNILKESKSRVINLLNSAVNFILQQRIDVNKYGSWFPSFYFDSVIAPERSRLAWCYGDLGVATALWQAGKALNRDDLGKLSLEVFEHTAINRRDMKKNSVFDACICHGAAGIAQIYYSIYTETHNSKFKDTYEYWKQSVWDMVTIDGQNRLTFNFYNPIPSKHLNRTSILEGVTGVGLFLLDPDSMLNELLLLR